MKSNLENNFKNAFEEYELPYNEKAWTSLNEKLDKLQGVNTPKVKPGNTWKWIAGVVAVVSTVVVFTILNNEKSISNTNKLTVATTEQKKEGGNENTSVTNEAEQVNKSKESVATSDLNKIATTVESGNQKNSSQKENTSNQDIKQDSHLNNPAKEQISVNSSTEKDNSNSDKGDGSRFTTRNTSGTVVRTPIALPKIESVCENTNISVENKNDVSLVIIAPNGSTTTVGERKTIQYKPTEAGIYTISDKQTGDKSTFIVKEAPKVDFTINKETKYENGIPSFLLETHSGGSNFEWNLNGKGTWIRHDRKKAYANFYYKGTYEISLTTTNSEGCKGTITKEITIDEDYNLMAVNSFKPSGINNRFIPFALTVRNTEFKLFIIEPRTGRVIFETTSLEGWDGTDRTTNSLAEESKSYAWKVILANPEPGEPKEYKGVVVRH